MLLFSNGIFVSKVVSGGIMEWLEVIDVWLISGIVFVFFIGVKDCGLKKMKDGFCFSSLWIFVLLCVLF